MKSFYIDADTSHQSRIYSESGWEGRIDLMAPSDANAYNLDDFVDKTAIDMNYIVTPKLYMKNAPIPYHVMDHKNISFLKSNMQNEAESFVNDYFKYDKFLFSTNPMRYFCIHFHEFKYAILKDVQSGYLTTPFLLFDSAVDKFLCFDFDLEVNFFSRSKALGGLNFCQMTDVFWNEFFRDKFPRSVDHNRRHIEIVNQYFISRFPSVEPIELR